LRSVSLRADPAAVAASYAGMLDWRGFLEELAGIKVPTLVLAGDRDSGFAAALAHAPPVALDHRQRPIPWWDQWLDDLNGALGHGEASASAKPAGFQRR